MRFRVELTAGAQRDLEDIHGYVAEFDSPASADHVLDRLADVAETLAESHDRGVHPPELLELGIREYRQLFFKPYRVIYRVLDDRVVIYLVADGRRDMPALVARRLLGG